MTSFQESSLVSAVSSLFASYGPAVLNGLIVVSTIGGQSLIKRLTFACPCAYPLNIYQSLVFLFGPCLALFFFAVLINQSTWRLVHGCCFRMPSARHPLTTALLYWIRIIGQASIAPVAWLFVALLDGGYYSCLKAADFCQGSPLCAHNQQGEENGKSKEKICEACICSLDPAALSFLQSQSQVLAWALLVSVGIIALTTICTIRMCDRYTFVQSSYVNVYRETERRVFEEMAKEVANSTAQNNSRAFFGKQKLSKEDWDWLSSLPSLDDPFMFARHLRTRDRVWPQSGEDTAAEDNYTTLQRWNRNRSHGAAAGGNASNMNGYLTETV